MWPSFLCGCGVGAVAMIVVMVLFQALLERGTPPAADGYESGEP